MRSFISSFIARYPDDALMNIRAINGKRVRNKDFKTHEIDKIIETVEFYKNEYDMYFQINPKHNDTYITAFYADIDFKQTPQEEADEILKQ